MLDTLSPDLPSSESSFGRFTMFLLVAYAHQPVLREMMLTVSAGLTWHVQVYPT